MSLTTRSMLPLRSSRPRIVSSGHHLEDQAGIAWRAAEVAIERDDRDVIVGDELRQPVRPAADRPPRGRRARAVRHDAHDERDRKRRRRDLELKRDRVRIEDLDRRQIAIGALPARDELRIQESAERERDIGRGHLAAVVEQHATRNLGNETRESSISKRTARSGTTRRSASILSSELKSTWPIFCAASSRADRRDRVRWGSWRARRDEVGGYRAGRRARGGEQEREQGQALHSSVASRLSSASSVECLERRQPVQIERAEPIDDRRWVSADWNRPS